MNRFTFVLLTAITVIFSAVLVGCSDRGAENKSASTEAPQQASETDTPAHIGADDHSAPHEEQEGMAHEQGKHADMQGASHWDAPAIAATLINPVTADTASVQRGRDLFLSNCASCHGSSGRGDGPVSAALTPKPADLVTMAPMHPAGAFFWKIKNGRGPMPAWENTLRENQMWDLVNYIKSLGETVSSDAGTNDNDGHNHAH